MTPWAIGMTAFGFSAAGVAATAAAMIAPRCGAWGPVVYRGRSDGARIALTFDDGPTPGGTDGVLDALRAAGARATFFVIGANVDRHPDLVRRMHDEGHQVANHSYDHSHYGALRGPHYWRAQIEQTDAAIAHLIGVRPAMFRPPMGVKSPFIAAAARQAGQTVVTWGPRGRDCLRGTTARRIVQRITAGICPGDIALLHDGVDPHRHRDPRVTVETVAPLIAALRTRRLEPARLDELLDRPAYA